MLNRDGCTQANVLWDTLAPPDMTAKEAMMVCKLLFEWANMERDVRLVGVDRIGYNTNTQRTRYTRSNVFNVNPADGWRYVVGQVAKHIAKTMSYNGVCDMYLKITQYVMMQGWMDGRFNLLGDQ